MLEKFGGRTLWLASFALGLLATAMMLRLPEEAPASAAPEKWPV
jgi:hypothetical protein